MANLSSKVIEDLKVLEELLVERSLLLSTMDKINQDRQTVLSRSLNNVFPDFPLLNLSSPVLVESTVFDGTAPSSGCQMELSNARKLELLVDKVNHLTKSLKVETAFRRGIYQHLKTEISRLSSALEKEKLARLFRKPVSRSR